jgi:CheY-like chemotaxis protein
MATILLVDDEPDLLGVLAILLDLEGFAVVTATDGVKALQALEAHAVDLVITDLMMPNMDGLTLCRRLRANEATRGVPVILNSAGASEPPGAGEQFDLFMRKPAHFGEQLEVIRRLLGKK